MTKTEVTKTVVGTSAGIGSYTIVRTITRAHVVPKGPVSAVLLFVGGVALAFWVSDNVQNHVEKMIDDFVAKWKTAKSSVTE